MSLKLYRPNREGGLEPVAEPSSSEVADYRATLRSRRWRPALLHVAEADKTNPLLAVAVIAAISALTFIVIVLGYWSGFWR